MKIITASSAADVSTACSPSANDAQPGELAHCHPARSLFTLTVIETNFTLTVIETKARETTLRLRRRHPASKTQDAVQGALGCVINYAARFTAQPYFDHCDLSEYELHVHKPFTANTLLVVTRIDVVRANCATYHCNLYTQETQQSTLVANAQGTLVRHPLDASHNTNSTSGKYYL